MLNYCFSPHCYRWTFSLETKENDFFKEIYDGNLCKAAESFEDEIIITKEEEEEEEEEAKTVEKSRFVELLIGGR